MPLANYAPIYVTPPPPQLGGVLACNTSVLRRVGLAFPLPFGEIYEVVQATTIVTVLFLLMYNEKRVGDRVSP